jgi:N6-adenosine-specific RNA methylase IME4
MDEQPRRRGRPPISNKAMTPLQRQRRHRALLKHAVKRERRETRERAMAQRTIAAAALLAGLLPVYGVIYLDPPWRFQPYSRISGMDRAADNHYPTLDLAALKAMKVPAAEDCVLFLWATAPMLLQAAELMAAWGFTYKTHVVWEKDQIGTGYWVRSVHELLLIGVRGNVPAPLPGTQIESIVPAPRGEHSAKPEVFARWIQQMFPNVPKLEMFARTQRPGWDCWGNEVGDAELPAAADGAEN